MPTRLLLDGPDIETVLTRVQEEHGSAARIVHAEKVRSGGLAGFFAKERYEVSVEVDADAAPDATPALSDLMLNVTPAGLRSRHQPLCAEPLPGAETDDASPYVDDAPARSVDHTVGEAAYDDLPPALRIAQEMDGPAPSRTALPRVSTGGAAFADVLGSITSSLGSSIDLPLAAAAASAVEAATADADAGVDSFVPAPRPVALPMGRHASRVIKHVDPEPAVTAPVAAPPVPPSTALATTSDRLPAPRPPRAPGAILVVLGDARVGAHAAHDLARSMTLDPEGVLLASRAPMSDAVPEPRRLPTAPEARIAAGRLMMQDRPAVVVVHHPITGDASWVNDVLDALGASAVWAVVDATRKVDDLARWTRSLRRVDALVVHNVAATDDPHSIHALGLPVALLDARPAAGSAWYALDTPQDPR